jgi:hypothetical protein
MEQNTNIFLIIFNGTFIVYGSNKSIYRNLKKLPV